MSRARPTSVAPRSRSHLEDKGLKMVSIFRVRSITLSFLDGFGNYFAEMLTETKCRAQDPGS